MRRAPADSGIIPHTATAARTAGEAIKYHGGVGIYVDKVANGAIGALAIEGQFRVIKNAAEVWLEGDKIYFDDAAGDFTITAGALNQAGHATTAAASADLLGEIYLNPAFIVGT
jgi:predicted RecA/RadA family phage recombinase